MNMAALERPRRCRRAGDSKTRACGPPSSLATEQQRSRARQLLAAEISFVPHAEFRGLTDEGALPPIERQPSAGSYHAVAATAAGGLAPYLARLSATALLTADQERLLFQRMNYLKYRANCLRAKLDPDALDLELLTTAERLLDESRAIRDRIVRANVRLVVSIIKRFVTSRSSFDEVLSDGLVTLLKAVERFDFSRGFRFSTYAYRAISRNTLQALAKRANNERHFVQFPDAAWEVVDESDHAPPMEHDGESLRETVRTMLHRLDPRERFIVCGRFGLGSQPQVRTFQSLADELGVSKERVRQLERRAIAKLHDLARQMGMQQFLDPGLD